MDQHQETGSATFVRLGLYAVRPFWENYPYVNIGCLLTPDLLHQLHKGMMKDHLTKWVSTVLGKQVIDEQHTAMPEYHGMRHFKNGISSVSQWTGRELKEMAKVLLPVVSDGDQEVVAAARALLDFMYLSHYSLLTDSELDAMDDALRTFHQNKAVFRQEGVVTTKKAFHGIPKLHMIMHYLYLICQLGTPDGYNTETSEWLHIDFAKMGYRASNKLNAVKQMALYIQCIEAITMHAAYMDQEMENREYNEERYRRGEEEVSLDEVDDKEDEWDEWYDEEEEDNLEDLQDAGVRVELETRLVDFLIRGQAAVGAHWEVEPPHADDPPSQHPRLHPAPEYVLAKAPTTTNVSLDYLATHHNATKLPQSLRQYLVRKNPHDRNPELPPDLMLNIWSCACLFHLPPPFKPSEEPRIDVICVQPAKID